MVDQPEIYFNAIYEVYYKRVIGFVVAKCSNIADVEDIVQETFGEYYQTICKKGSSYIKNEEAFLMQIAKSKIYKHYTLIQKMKNILPLKKTNEDGDEYDTPNIENIDVEEKYINDITVNEIWKIIKGKTKEVQKVFALYYYCDKPIKEIAEILELSQSNIKHKLYRTLSEIRTIYCQGGDTE